MFADDPDGHPSPGQAKPYPEPCVPVKRSLRSAFGRPLRMRAAADPQLPSGGPGVWRLPTALA